MKTIKLDTLIDKHIGKKGTKARDKFEQKLELDLLGEIVKSTRQKRNLTQEQLGEILGVQKAQISKIENNLTDVRLSTVLKVFDALDATLDLTVRLK